jgi:hypothetical protein
LSVLLFVRDFSVLQISAGIENEAFRVQLGFVFNNKAFLLLSIFALVASLCPNVSVVGWTIEALGHKVSISVSKRIWESTT